jgi:hypothetical protein
MMEKFPQLTYCVINRDWRIRLVRLVEPDILHSQIICGERLGLPDLLDHCDRVVGFEE